MDPPKNPSSPPPGPGAVGTAVSPSLKTLPLPALPPSPLIPPTSPPLLPGQGAASVVPTGGLSESAMEQIQNLMKENNAQLSDMMLKSLNTLNEKVAAVEESVANVRDDSLKNVEPDLDSVSVFGSSPENRSHLVRELTKENQKPPVVSGCTSQECAEDLGRIALWWAEVTDTVYRNFMTGFAALRLLHEANGAHTGHLAGGSLKPERVLWSTVWSRLLKQSNRQKEDV